MTQYGIKRAAYLMTKIKSLYPQIRSIDFTVYTYGGSLIELVKAKLNDNETVIYDGLSMEVYNSKTDNIIPIMGY